MTKRNASFAPFLAAVLLSAVGATPRVCAQGANWQCVTDSAGWPAGFQSAVTFAGQMWIISNSTQRTEVWRSPDGKTWTRVTDAPGWPARTECGLVDFGGKLWILGGAAWNQNLNDVWNSTDGLTWNQVTSEAPWSPRCGHGVLVHDAKIWVLGGHSSQLDRRLSDVWYTTDGSTWTCATESAPWGPREALRSVSFAGRLWVMSGRNGSAYNDIWSSTDGTNWVRVRTTTPWGYRTSAAVVVCQNRMWFLGGYDEYHGAMRGDVYYSSDGVDWVMATEPADWGPRCSHSAVAFKGIVWILGGSNPFDCGDVWSSYSDGSWVEATPAAEWCPRFDDACIEFNDYLWVLGGFLRDWSGGGLTSFSDVWRSSDGIHWSCVTDSAPWRPIDRVRAVVFQNKLWVVGADTGDVWCSSDGGTWSLVTPRAWSSEHQWGEVVVFRNEIWKFGRGEVWHSADGATWTVEMSAVHGWTGVTGCAVHDGRVWVTGSFLNDVWFSDDGLVWHPATLSAPWPSTGLVKTLVSHDGILWALGGYGGCWYTSDGSNWYKGQAHPDFGVRDQVDAATFNSRLWVLGGRSYGLESSHADGSNDIWSTDAKSLQLTRPNSSEFLASGDTYRLRWKATPGAFDGFRLLLSLDRGYSFTDTIAAGLAPGDSSFPWNVPRVNSSSCVAMVEGLHGDVVGMRDRSPGPFTIATSVRLLTPNGGEVLRGGSTENITWFCGAGGIVHVRLLLSRDGGANYQDTILPPTFTGLGTCVWSVPQDNSSRCRVQVQILDSAGVKLTEDASDTNFTIDADPPAQFSLLSPPDGEWQGGSPIFQWQASGDNFALSHYLLRVAGPLDTIIRDGLNSTLLPDTSGADWTTLASQAPWRPRAGASIAVYDGRLWILGGVYDFVNSFSLNDVWSSPDGANWQCEMPQGPWHERSGAQLLSFGDRLWLLGGGYDNYVTGQHYCYNDVWYSYDGCNWVCATASAAWAPRTGFQAVVYDGRVWVLGGYDSGRGFFNDVWCSSDGVNWTQVTAAADWSYPTFAAVQGGFLFVIGEEGDVWRSNDGTNWTRIADSVQCLNRLNPRLTVYADKFWLLGGEGQNDIWSSTDGITWVQVASHAAWCSRSGHCAVTFGGRMLVLAGMKTDHTGVSDVWSSADGVAWSDVTSSNHGWCGREGHTAVSAGDSTFVLGGYGNANQRYLNDVWCSTDGRQWYLAGTAPWDGRSGHASVLYDSRIWVLGGWSLNCGFFRDVWSSADGVNWTQATPTADWSARHGLASLAFAGKIWVLGGMYNQQYMDDVWYSTDGISWTCATDSAGWTGRRPAAVVFNDQMWVVGTDVWRSSDGVSWIQVLSTTPWTSTPLVVEHDHRIWAVIGKTSSGGSEVWSSSDGQNWQKATASPPWGAIVGAASVANDSGVMVLGGDGYSSGCPRGDLNDVWATQRGVRLDEGSYTWDVTAVDKAGNERRCAQPFAVNVDTTPPDTFDLSSPPANETVYVQYPRLYWHPTPDIHLGSGISRYELWIGNTRDRDSMPATDTSAVPRLPLPNHATSTWFVRAFDRAGNQRMSSQTWDITVSKYDSVAPSVPVLIFPANGTVMRDTYPSFRWHASSDDTSGIDHYTLQVADDPGFSDSVTVDVADTGYVFHQRLPDTTWYWRLRAVDRCLNQSDWSDAWSFELDSRSPGTPTLLQPACGSWLPTRLVDFQWSAVSWGPGVAPASAAVAGNGNLTPGKKRESQSSETADPSRSASGSPVGPGLVVGRLKRSARNNLASRVEYVLQIDTLSSFISPLVEDTTELTTTTITLPSEGEYFWRVRAFDAAGNQGSFSGCDSFGVDTCAPSVPKQAQPDSGSLRNSGMVTYAWHRSSDYTSGVRCYALQYANNPGFSGAVTKDPVADTIYTVFLPLTDTTWYWRLRATDRAGNQCNWSSAWSFEVDSRTPLPPTLLQPIGGAWLNLSTAIFQWSQVTSFGTDAGAPVLRAHVGLPDAQKGVPGPGVRLDGGKPLSLVHYVFQLDTLRGFVAPLKTETTLCVRDTESLSERRFFWRVMAFDDAGNRGSFSAIDSFGVDTTPPTPPVLELPPDDTTLQDSVDLVWLRVSDRVSGVAAYQAQLAPDSTFASPVRDTAVTDTLLTLFLPETLYFWHVRASDCAGNRSLWSQFRRFRVGPPESVSESPRALPSRTVLGSPVPSPFSDAVVIPYELAVASVVRLAVYDLSGRELTELSGGLLQAGSYRARWNGRTAAGEMLPDGIYVVRFTVEGRAQTRKLAMQH